MPTVTIIQYVLWIAAPLGQVVIAVTMIYRNLCREYPLFLCYTVFHVIQVIVAILALHYSYTTYFYVYWGSELIDAMLELAVIQEVFSHVFCAYEGLQALGLLLFRWATLVLLGIAIAASLSAPGSDSSRVIAGFLVMQRSVRIVQTGLLTLLFLFSRIVGLKWRTPVFGIALGFAVMAVISTISAALRAQLGVAGDPAYSYVEAASYNFAVGVWVYYLLLPGNVCERAPLPDSDQLQQWNRALQRLLRT